jgi:hypothetical protein
MRGINFFPFFGSCGLFVFWPSLFVSHVTVLAINFNSTLFLLTYRVMSKVSQLRIRALSLAKTKDVMTNLLSKNTLL